MKIIKERFNTEKDRENHYNLHVLPAGKSSRKNKFGKEDYEFTPYEFPDEIEYEKAAEEFAYNSTPEGSIISRNSPNVVVGFMDKQGRVHLYDKRTGEFTVYKIEHGEIITISYYLFSNDDRYERDRKQYYYKEIPKDYNKQVTKRYEQ